MSVPPLTLFRDPRSRFIPPLPYRMEESYIIDYDQHYDDYYDRPMDRQQHIPIPRKYQDREYVSPFQAYASYEHTPPPEQRVQIQTTDHVPIIDIPLPPAPYNPPFSECGLPNGYAKLDRQRYYQEQMNKEIEQQLKYGMKSKETRPKQEIDEFYKNLKITYNHDGLISIDNVSDKPQKKIQQNTKVPLSNQSYRKAQSNFQYSNPYKQFKQDHVPTQPSNREIPLQAQPQQQSQQQFYTQPSQQQQQQSQQHLTKHYPSSRQLPQYPSSDQLQPATFYNPQHQPQSQEIYQQQQSYHQPQEQIIEPAESEIVNRNDDENSNESVVQAHPLQQSSLQNPL